MAAKIIKVAVVRGVQSEPSLTISHPSVRAKYNERIVWDFPGPFTILFGGKTPFRKAAYASEEGKPIAARVNKHGRGDPEMDRYKYSVVVAVGDQVLHEDPDVIVDDTT